MDTLCTDTWLILINGPYMFETMLLSNCLDEGSLYVDYVRPVNVAIQIYILNNVKLLIAKIHLLTLPLEWNPGQKEKKVL